MGGVRKFISPEVATAGCAQRFATALIIKKVQPTLEALGGHQSFS
jgi:hypothetical protein